MSKHDTGELSYGLFSLRLFFKACSVNFYFMLSCDTVGPDVFRRAQVLEPGSLLLFCFCKKPDNKFVELYSYHTQCFCENNSGIHKQTCAVRVLVTFKDVRLNHRGRSVLLWKLHLPHDTCRRRSLQRLRLQQSCAM